MTAAALTSRNTPGKPSALHAFNEREVLTEAGKLRAEVAEKLALERYASFDAARREAARLAADEADIEDLQDVEKAAARKRRNKGSEDA
jgi:hypothetical protein